MYVLIISRGYPSNKYKSNGIFEFDQAKALAEAGHKIVFASIDMRSIRRARKWGYESLNKDKVAIEAINIPCGRIPNPIFDKISIYALKRLYRRIEKKYGEPQIIHAHFIKYGFIAVKVFKDINIPIVLTEHYSEMNKLKLEPYYYKLGLYTYTNVSKLISVSKYLAANIKTNFNIEAAIVPNIVDSDVFVYEKTKRENDLFNFVSIGSLKADKRMDLLIKAFYKSFNNNDYVRLFIIGHGSEFAMLSKLIKDLNITDKVFLLGFKQRADIAQQLRKSDCFVLVSRHETFGVAYIEAMAMGLPVVATRCGGPEDFIDESNGILVNVDDEFEVSKAMLKIYNKIDKYNSVKISTDIKNKYSPEVIANKLSSIYNEIIKENKADA